MVLLHIATIETVWHHFRGSGQHKSMRVSARAQEGRQCVIVICALRLQLCVDIIVVMFVLFGFVLVLVILYFALFFCSLKKRHKHTAQKSSKQFVDTRVHD